MFRRNTNQRSYSPRNRGGGAMQKTFDPSYVIENLKRRKPEDMEEEYVAKHKFSDFSVSLKLKENITKRGFVAPTPIQDEAIDVILKGKDVVGIANTGTGKTAAFLIPLIDKVIKNRREKILIMAPTRELAIQIESELALFSENLKIYSAVCIGGASIRSQIYALSRRPNFLIGTPGRIQDLVKQRYIDLTDYRSIVLDEVDRMLDMGFLRDMENIISKLSRSRQSLFFSATMTDQVKKVMGKFISNPVQISVKTNDTTLNIEQDIVRVQGREKAFLLLQMLRQKDFEKVLVFGRTKHGIERLKRQLYREGLDVASIHGNRSQSQRQTALNNFRVGEINVLLATDIAARGIDVNDITHVINYDLPSTYEDYIHRIGRTGRANKKGIALTFIDR